MGGGSAHSNGRMRKSLCAAGIVSQKRRNASECDMDSENKEAPFSTFTGWDDFVLLKESVQLQLQLV
jgi:hypothetical protein